MSAAKSETRRERLRRETSAEIRAHALRMLTKEGPGAISLRAIARDMGMTAGAIYGYFATRDTLVESLMDEVYDDLAGHVEAARDGASNPRTRLIAWGRAFREWALSNPGGFRLIYGDGVPGYRHGDSGVAAAADRRMCVGLAGLVGDLRGATAGSPKRGTWREYDSELVAASREGHDELDPAALALTLRAWGRMHGLVALEVYGHLAAQTDRPEKLYNAELDSLAAELGH